MKFGRVGLALILTLQAAPVRAAAADDGSDELGRAFGNLRRFAERAEQPAAAQAPPRAPPAARETDTHSDDRLGVRPSVSWDGSWKDVIGENERDFLDEIAELTTGLDGDQYDVNVSIQFDMFPAIKVTRVDRRGRPLLNVWINSGALAFTENRDEFAALLGQALAREAPEVLLHRDDPRVMRRIEEQVAFESLPKAARRAVLADVSAIERLRAAGRRPWALTDLEKRSMTRYRKQWDERFKRARVWRPVTDGDELLLNDELYEVRLLAQKVAVTYLQERENIRDLIKTSHEFTPGWRAIRANAFGLYRDTLHPRLALVRFIGVPLAVFVGVVGFLYYVPVWPWVSSLGDLIATSPPVDRMARSFRALLRLQGSAWMVEARGLGIAGSIAYDAALSGLTAAGDFAGAILGPVWTEFINVLTPLVRAALDGLVAGYDFLAWLTSTVWIYVLLPAVGLAALYYFARSAVDAFIEQRRTDGAIFHRWTLGHLNRWRRPNFVEERLQDIRAGATDLERVIRVADDLHRVWTDGASLPFAQAIKFQPQTLRVLGNGYQAPEDFWTMLKALLIQLTMRIDDGRLTAADLARVFGALAPKSALESFADGSRSGLGGSGPSFAQLNHVLRRAIERDDVRPALGRIYSAARLAYPVAARTLEDLSTLDHPWADFNELAGVTSAPLGLARVAAEIESIDPATSVTAVQLLNGIVARRLDLPRLANRLNQSYLPAFLVRARDGGFADHEAAFLITTFNADKRLMRPGDRVTSEPAGDGWPALAGRLRAASLDAFVLGRLEEAVALATLEGEVQSHIPNPHQLRSLLYAAARGAGWPVSNALRHATEFAFLQKLRGLKRASAVAEYVRTELIPRGVVIERLTPILFVLITERPAMIRDEADARAVIEHEFFWPQRPLPRGNVFRDMPAALRASWKNHKPIDEPLAKALFEQKEKNPRAWLYETSHSQRLHGLLVQRLRELDVLPRDLAGLKNLWLALTDRGTTAETDRLMHEMIALADADEVSDLRDLATREGRVWEADLHSRMSLSQAKGSTPYLRLIAAPADDRKRRYLIDEIVGDLKATMPERGLAFAQFLEDLSVRINSSYDEAKRLSEAKGDVASGSVGDDSLRSVRGVFRDVARWPREDQFNFVKFLRAESPAGARLRDAFPSVGLERIQRMYEILPLAARVGLFDTFFTHGLVGEGPEAARWVNRLSRHIVGGDRTEAQRVTLQVLTAFLFAVREVGNAQMTTTILSYLYALPSSAVASPVEVLKLVLEIFGATGIKVGQFTYASQILGDAGETLRSLQSRARVPERIEIFEDVYDMLGVPVGTPLPFLVLELLGAASMKYAFMGQDRATLAKLVIKVFRLDAMNNVDLQFDVLEHMSRYLIDHYGPRYGVFKIIIKSARLAVKREGSMRNEIRRSRIARHRIYADRSTDRIKVEVPREDLINARMIIAQFAPGVPFDDLPAEAKPLFARTLLALENDIYFADVPVIRFDPDRHAGNAQMLFRVDEDGDVTIGPRHALGPIDFGQLLRMTRVQRERITKLFALAQIAGKVSVNDWVTTEIADLLDLGEEPRRTLRRNLRAFVKSAGPRPVTLYVSVLAALEAAGFELRDTTYIDFVRGIIQLTPFERFAPDAPAPSRTFEAAVLAEVKAYATRHEFDPNELRAIDAINRWRRLRGARAGAALDLLPTDLAQVNFDEIIHREKEVGCPTALSAAE